MILWTAFLLGLLGSLHCAGMCGPLMLALPSPLGPPAISALLVRRLVYNLGRTFTYALLGLIFGLVGQTLVMAGLQRWLSIAAGLAILTGVLSSSRFVLSGPVSRSVTRIKSAFGRLLQKRGLAPQFGLGLLNGLLPCGLVYVACAGATASGSALGGMSSMIAFGAGTIPMMLALGVAGPRLNLSLRFKLQRLVPACLILVGTLLILRGLSLGIPYISPDLNAAVSCGGCH